MPVDGDGSDGDILFVHACDHPSSPEYAALALLPAGAAADAGAVLQRLQPVFAANDTGSGTLFSSLPTYVHLIPGSPVDASAALALFRAAYGATRAAAGVQHGGDRNDWELRTICAELLAGPNDTWEAARQGARRP
jgi:hypothetical protein